MAQNINEDGYITQYPYFNMEENITQHPRNERFALHVHDGYEIYMFIEGDTKYIIEENVYNLEPYDVIILRKNQLHNSFHNSPSRYHRFFINFSSEFFELTNCEEYEAVFKDLNRNNFSKIDSKTVKKSGLYDAIQRVKKYSNGFKNLKSPVVLSVLVEILYIINNIEFDSAPLPGNHHLKEVISYLNENFTKDTSLDELERMFFISKYHLCHIFPEATGLTIHQYITKKRLLFARDLIKEGMPIYKAAESAGFNNYSSFYRAYVNEYGISPNNTDLKKQS